MNFFEFKGIKIAGMATAVPDRHQKMSDYDYLFAEGEVECLWRRNYYFGPVRRSGQ